MKPVTSHLAVFWLVIALFGPLVHAAPSHKIFLTASKPDGASPVQPNTRFACSDKIMAVIEVNGLSRDQHRLDAVWRDPRGKDREHTEHEFIVRGDTKKMLVWLKLHRPTEAAMVSFMDPSAGMDEFIGEWELHVAIDHEPIDVKSFSVLC